jgi:aconitate hydratase
MKPLEELGFHLVGYGCTTCIGNSGPVDERISAAVKQNGLVVASVLSGNRNFEGRVSPVTLANYLASPPLVVAYALAGTVDIDFESDPIGTGGDGKPVFLRDIWPTPDQVTETVRNSLVKEMFVERYAHVFEGTAEWQKLDVPRGETFAWRKDSTYVRKPPFFEDLSRKYDKPKDIENARVLAVLGDSVTTDHISPAGSIAADSPAARYLVENGVERADWNQYGARRGNHEVMMRGTFANIRLKNALVPGVEGGVTRHFPDGAQLSIYDAAMLYAKERVPLLIVAGKEYGTGSSRDWAAKGTMLLGVKAVLAESFERIHRSNLVGMGVLPLLFFVGQNAQSLGLTGEETFRITGISAGLTPRKQLTVHAGSKTFEVVCGVDTPQEVSYVEHGGILPYVLRTRLAAS